MSSESKRPNNQEFNDKGIICEACIGSSSKSDSSVTLTMCETMLKGVIAALQEQLTKVQREIMVQGPKIPKSRNIQVGQKFCHQSTGQVVEIISLVNDVVCLVEGENQTYFTQISNFSSPTSRWIFVRKQ